MEKKRGGRHVYYGEVARQRLLQNERHQFIDKKWPNVVAAIHRLSLDAQTLLKAAQ